MQLKPANTIKIGTYTAKGDFSASVDEIRINLTDMNFNVELIKAGNVVKLFEVALHEVKLDGTVRGMLYDDYNIELNFSLGPV